MSDILIRNAVAGDEPQIHNACMRSIREVCILKHGADEVRGWGNRPLADRWMNAIKEGYVWVAEMNSIIHGVAYLKVNPQTHNAYIHSLYLTPEVLGRGIGNRLSNLMLKKAKQLNVKVIRLESTLTAHAFYKKIGFRDTGLLKQVEIGGSLVSCIPMEMVINDEAKTPHGHIL